MRRAAFFLSAVTVFLFLSASLLHAQQKSEWPNDCQVGMFLHFLPEGESAETMQKQFQVERLADQIDSAGADYFCLTMYQNSGWFNAPNDEYESVTGYEHNSRCSKRDIPMEMADALARRGIKFFIYVTGQVPNRDPQAQKAYGLEVGPSDQKITLEFAKKWSRVFREWSLRYGDKVSGWWVDGCYQWCDFNDEIAAIYRDALKAGNPNAVVAFNPGVKRPEWKTSDYTAGEINDPFAETGFSPKNEEGQKNQILTFLGDSWGQNNTRFTKDEWVAWAKSAVQAGLALTFDAGLKTDETVPAPGGFTQDALDQVHAIVNAVKGITPEDEFRLTVEHDWERQEYTAGRNLDSSESLAALIDRSQQLLERLDEEEYISSESAEMFQKAIDGAGEGDLNALSPDQIRSRYLALRWISRSVIFANPLVKDIPIVFLKSDRYIWQLIHEYLSYYYSHTNMIGGELMLLKDPGHSFEAESLSAGKFPRGWFSTPSLSFDGKTLYFAFADFSKVIPEGMPRTTLQQMMDNGRDREVDAYLAREEGKFHLYKLDLETGKAEQLTAGPDDDFDPAELPDGDLIFVSTRRGSFARCTANYEPVETATLHRRMKDGTIQCLSWHETNEWNPSVLNDGRIIYSRWDYVDREAARFMNLWVTNPDGTGAKALFGNYTEQVVASLQAKQIPDSSKILFLGSGHHIAVGGPIAVLDPAKMKYDPKNSEDTLDCLDIITPDVGFPETPDRSAEDGNTYQVSDHYYYSPYPLSEDFYLTAYSHDPNGGYLAKYTYGYHGSCGEMFSAGKLGLYYRDRFGNLELIYADPVVGCRYPIQVKSRTKPQVIASQLPKTETAEGTFVLSDIYESLVPLPRDRKITELRIFQILPHWPDYQSSEPRISVPRAANGRALLGTVPVEEDGSAHFTVPAGKPLFFQAVDAEGKAVHTMMSEVYLQPGENRGCVGCHEQIQTTSENYTAQKKAFQRTPDSITPGPAGTAPFSFPLFVQPILDRVCIRCHNGEAGAFEPDLRGTPTDNFTKSYDELTNYTRRYEWGGDTIARIASLPGEGVADLSELTKILDDENHGAKINLSDSDRRAFYLWMDANIPFFGTAEKEEQEKELRGEPVAMPPVQ